jgi:uncharacterized protein YutE (UPF0331/DUF86 family)
MLDMERILVKSDELDSYLAELNSILPLNYDEYAESVEKKRACERLLHVCIECVIDICSIIATDLRLGLPSSEEDLFRKLKNAKVISKNMEEKLREMRGFRNILVHRYGTVDDELVYDTLENNLTDFQDFRKEILKPTKSKKIKQKNG